MPNIEIRIVARQEPYLMSEPLQDPATAKFFTKCIKLAEQLDVIATGVKLEVATDRNEVTQTVSCWVTFYWRKIKIAHLYFYSEDPDTITVIETLKKDVKVAKSSAPEAIMTEILLPNFKKAVERSRDTLERALDTIDKS